MSTTTQIVQPVIGNSPAWKQSIDPDGPIDITVCIANWNCREMLRKCLESLYAWPQGIRLEVVIVDNNSADGAADMVERDFPLVVLLRNGENRGFARASNQAAAIARGRYLFFLNNDTEVPALALRRLCDFADRHPEAGIVGPRLRDSEGNFQISYRQKPSVAALLHRTAFLRWTGLFSRAYRRYRRNGFDPFHCGPVELLMGAAVLLRREVFFECGRWDEDFAFGGEDLELAARVGRRYPILFAPVVEITHHGRVSSRLNVGFSTESVAIGYVQYLRKVGTTRAGLWLYKVAVTMDAPLQLIAKLVQWGGRRLLGKPAKAAKSRLAAQGLAHFVFRSLGKFWRS
ncbi:MAG: glycosyltransferase family 2 protein [Gemmataceae bacterium]